MRAAYFYSMVPSLLSGAIACDEAVAPVLPIAPCSFASRPPESPPREKLLRVTDRWEVVRLLDRSFERKPAEVSAGKPLASWRGAMPEWEKQAGKNIVRWTLKGLRPFSDPVNTIVLTVRPFGATHVRVAPRTTMVRGFRDRDSRRHEEPIPPSEAPDKDVVLRIDIERLLRHNWDQLNTGQLVGLEIELLGGQPERAALVAVELWGRSATLSSQTKATYVDRAGEVRRAWILAPHTSITTHVEPQADTDLRFEVSGEGPTAWELAVDADHVERSKTGKAGPRWRSQSVSWARLQSKGGRITFHNRGDDTLYVGEPRVVVRSTRRPPDVLVYLVDTLVATRVGAWGAQIPGISPAIDSLAQTGMTFGHAVAAASWTKPSVVSIMTSLPVNVHGVGSRGYADLLPERVDLLQERFRDAGFRTGSFLANAHPGPLSGLHRGFDATFTLAYWADFVGPLKYPTSDQLQETMLRWIDQEPDQPFFSYVHTIEVHEYERIGLWRRTAPEGWEPYDQAIHVQDAALGGALEALRSRHRDVVVVFVSDHGESFGDHGTKGHGTSLFEPQVHVPLIFWSPGRLPALTVNHPVSTLDLAPTLLDLYGLSPLPMGAGVSLLPYAEKKHAPLSTEVFSSRHQSWAPPELASLTTADGLKVIKSETKGFSAFDLNTDPCELTSLGTEHPLNARLLERLQAMRTQHRAFIAQHGSQQGTLSEDDLAALRGLGYVEGASP